MEAINPRGKNQSVENPNKRREFLKKSIMIGALTGISGASLFSGCKEESGEEVSPAEDLMREHGVLNNSALIIKNFIEDYHEKLEEDYLFPIFEKAEILTELVSVLRVQHQAGRKITGRIIEFAGLKSLDSPEDIQILAGLLGSFNSMYRPHEAREDTVLFPAIRKVIPGDEYFALGENFEDKEHELFGEEGFEGIVEKVGNMERELGIYDLNLFTPSSQ
jgi:hemerythrin-like domain-containing protein